MDETGEEENDSGYEGRFKEKSRCKFEKKEENIKKEIDYEDYVDEKKWDEHDKADKRK